MNDFNLTEQAFKTIESKFWLKGLFGIEKENIRVDKNGVISQKPHPAVFGDKMKHPYITTDFSESQVEMITPPMPDIEQALGFLETIHDIVSNELNNEYLWPQSIPPVLPADEFVPIARYANLGKNEEQYRVKLAQKYGRKKQAMSGIHFNFSLDESLMQSLFQNSVHQLTYAEFKNAVYLKITRQMLRFRWLYVLLYGNSPMADKSFDVKCRDFPVYFDANSRVLSLRNSCFGYGNLVELYPDYSSVEKYHESINRMVSDRKISLPKELYALVRPKFLSDKQNISYVEIRFIDIDPFQKIGLTREMLQFIHWLAIYGLLSKEPDDFSKPFQRRANSNYSEVSLLGLTPESVIINDDSQPNDTLGAGYRIITDMQKLFETLGINDPNYKQAIEDALCKIQNPEKRNVNQILDAVNPSGFISFHMQKAIEYAEQSRLNDYQFKGFDDMELSTQLVLREAVRRGIKFEILDREENFVRLERDGHVQLIKQATKTSLDNYTGILAMENKLVTKLILKEHGINVPGGAYFTDALEAKSSFQLFRSRGIVIKPKLTNFGEGITILKRNEDKSDFEKAIDFAFRYDSSILIEEFFAGKEFRIFVMDDQVVGILHRVPANVKGDGIMSIRELVDEKNKNPLRGKGYKTPLEKIQIGEIETQFLAEQGKTPEYIPALDETIYLRENSNISTGGDSIDYTDEIPESYKAIAIQAAKALKVKITGLDMIIKDIHEPANTNNYSIIEMNFNPAIHIHCHPFVGKNRRLNEKLLDLLGFPLIIMEDEQSFQNKKKKVCCCVN